MGTCTRSSYEDSSNARTLMCRMNELPCRVARIIKWFKEEPRRLGWIITASCFVFYTASYSIMFGYSLLLTQFINEFDAKVYDAGRVGCIMSAVAYCSSPITAFLLTKFSHRFVCVLGTLLCAVGAFTSSFVPSITYLYLTLGIVYGLGTNFLYHASLCLQLQYFPMNSERPVTIASGGFAASWMVTIPLLHLFITSYGWRMALQLLAAVILASCLVFCIPMCPFPSSMLDDTDEEEKKKLRRDSKKSDVKNDDKTSDLKSSTETRSKFATVLDYAKKPEVWMFFIGCVGTMACWSFYFVNIGDFLQSPDAAGLTENQAASIIFMCGIGEVAGKVLLIAIAGPLQRIPSIYVLIFGSVLWSVFAIGLVLSNSYIPAATFVVLAAFGRSIWHIYPITGGVEELKNAEVVSTVYNVGMGVGYLTGSFLVGALHDITGSYQTPMVIVAGVFIISGIFFLFVPIIRYIRSRKHKRTSYGHYYSINIQDAPLEDCDECSQHKRKLSKQERSSWTCDHKNAPKTVLVEDDRIVVDSLMSSV